MLGGYSLYIDGMLPHPVCRQRRFSSRSSSLKCKSPSGDYYCERGQPKILSTPFISFDILVAYLMEITGKIARISTMQHQRRSSTEEMQSHVKWMNFRHEMDVLISALWENFVSFSRSFLLKLSKTLQYTNTFKGMPNSFSNFSVSIHHPLGFSWHPDLKGVLLQTYLISKVYGPRKPAPPTTKGGCMAKNLGTLGRIERVRIRKGEKYRGKKGPFFSKKTPVVSVG